MDSAAAGLEQEQLGPDRVPVAPTWGRAVDPGVSLTGQMTRGQRARIFLTGFSVGVLLIIVLPITLLLLSDPTEDLGFHYSFGLTYQLFAWLPLIPFSPLFSLPQSPFLRSAITTAIYICYSGALGFATLWGVGLFLRSPRVSHIRKHCLAVYSACFTAILLVSWALPALSFHLFRALGNRVLTGFLLGYLNVGGMMIGRLSPLRGEHFFLHSFVFHSIASALFAGVVAGFVQRYHENAS